MSQETGVQLKAIYTIVEREGAKNRWVRIGIGFVNQDGSINVRLDAMPVNGRLHVRNHKRKDREDTGTESPSNDTVSLQEHRHERSVFDSANM